MRLLVLLSVAALLLAPAVAVAEWSDNFDSYQLGPLHGQGGWEGWNGSPEATAYVSDAYSLSSPNSVEIQPTSDCVQQFDDVNAGQWVFTGWVYVPTGATGEQYWILLNAYPTVGNYSWSLQVLFNMTQNVVVDYNDTTASRPLIRDQWVELRVEIDFAADLQIVYYNGDQFIMKGWTSGVEPGGALDLAALDLYSNGASAIYWDDLWLRPDVPPVPVEDTSWGRIKASYK